MPLTTVDDDQEPDRGTHRESESPRLRPRHWESASGEFRRAIREALPQNPIEGYSAIPRVHR